MSRLAIGTVQFGLAYGITNAEGQVPEAEVARILAHAGENNIRVLDTAALYGTSEKTLGHILPTLPGFEIITKTSKAVGAENATEAAARLEVTFSASLENLRTSSVHALIAHEADDLIGPFGEALWQAMVRLKEQGLTQKIGASVYTGAQIDTLLARYPLDLVQLPFNALDKRLIEGGQLERLRQSGCEIHCRSIFLQGLLIQNPEAIPPKFGPLSGVVRRLHHTFAEFGLSPLEGLIASVLGTPQIGRLVAGVTRLGELQELIAAEKRALRVLEASPDFSFALRDIRIDDPRILSPAHWGQLT